MGETNQRILIVLGVLIAGLLVALLVVVVTSGDSDPVVLDTSDSTSTTEPVEETTTTMTSESTEATETTEAPETTTSTSSTTTSSTTSSTTTTSTSSTTTSSTTSSTTTSSSAPPPPEPVEVFRGIADISSGDLWGTETIPLFFMSVSGEGFATSHRWGLQQSGSPPGPEVCRDSTVAPVDETVPFGALAFSVGWYGCFDVDGEFVGQLHIIDVQPDNERVIAEVVLWDFTP